MHVGLSCAQEKSQKMPPMGLEGGPKFLFTPNQNPRTRLEKYLAQKKEKEKKRKTITKIVGNFFRSNA
jgi:hypothetical protein